MLGQNVGFKAHVGGVDRQSAPLTHPEAVGGCGVRVRERGIEGGGGSIKVVMGQVLGGDEVGSRWWPKNAFVFNFLFEFGRLAFGG
jgi:hypothetical protein